MGAIRVCGVQMAVAPAKADNLPRILEYINASDCNFIVFPEMSLTGYNNDFSDSRTSEGWVQIANATRANYVTAIIGTGARYDGHGHIQARVIGDDGELVGTQDKLEPTESDRAWCRPGDALNVFENQGVAFGCLNGNDLWVAPGFGPYPDPRLSYQLGKRDAQVIFHLNHSGADPRYKDYYDANLRLRAWESGCYIVTVNAAAESGALNAPSGVVSPEGEWLVKCPLEGEQNFCYDLELIVEG